MKTNVLRSALFVTAAALFVSSCSEDKKEAKADEPRGIILANMDTTVSPKDDFYSYVNGTWMRSTEIPDDQVRWGGFNVLRKKTDKDMLGILTSAKQLDIYGPDTDQAKALMIFETKLDSILT